MKKSYLYFFLLFLVGCKDEKTLLNGYVEAEYQYIAPTSSGILKNIYVKRGDYVQTGSKLFDLEDLELKVEIENAKLEIQQEEISFKEDMKEYLRAQKLVKTNVVSQSEFDQKEAMYNASKASLNIAKQNLLIYEKKLDDSAPKALNDSYVTDTFFSPGEFIQAGRSVVSLLSPTNIKIRFFIPQQQLPKIKEQQSITISCDGCKKEIPAKIIYIAKQAEYTPPVIYSTESRQKMVYLVEAKPDQIEECLHPGLPVDINLEVR